ncbi:hypothetical protein, partial [Streptomyces sp. NPDC002587]
AGVAGIAGSPLAGHLADRFPVRSLRDRASSCVRAEGDVRYAASDPLSWSPAGHDRTEEVG